MLFCCTFKCQTHISWKMTFVVCFLYFRLQRTADRLSKTPVLREGGTLQSEAPTPESLSDAEAEEWAEQCSCCWPPLLSSCFPNRLQALSLVLLIPFLNYSSQVIVSSCCTETFCCSVNVTFTSKTNTSHLHKHNSGSHSSAVPDRRWADVGGEQPRAEVLEGFLHSLKETVIPVTVISRQHQWATYHRLNEMLLQYTSKHEVFIENKPTAALVLCGDGDHKLLLPLCQKCSSLAGMMFKPIKTRSDDKASISIVYRGAIEGMDEFVEDLLFCKMDEILRPK